MSKKITVTQSLEEHQTELKQAELHARIKGQNEIIDILVAGAFGKSYNLRSIEDMKFRSKDMEFLAKNVVENRKFKESLKKELQDIISNAIVDIETSRIKTRARLDGKLKIEESKLVHRLYDRECGKQEALEDLRTLLTGKGFI